MKRIRLLLLTALAVLALCAAASAEEPSVTRYGESAAATASAPGGADNDELFYQYMLRLGRGDTGEDLPGGSTGKHLARAGLSKDAQNVYDALAERIEEIASGGGSSSISVPLSSLGFEISSNEAPNVVGEQGKPLYSIKVEGSSEPLRVATFNSMTGSDNLSEIVHALLADMPYALYWYDKTEALSFESGKYYLSETDKTIIEYVPSGAAVTFRFCVSQDYAARTLEGNNYVLNLNEVSSELAKKTQIAVTTAQDIIIDTNSAKSDYEKVEAYKEKICELVDYNDVAASDSEMPYGDPWQLICVFDEDTETKVVCEGYAKAFQYLCDLTSEQKKFKSDLIQCYTVSGYMSGGTGDGGEGHQPGAHMWNILTMDDGKNYLVDITNVDEGTAGAPDKLFLKGISETGVDTLTKDGIVYPPEMSYMLPADTESGSITYWMKENPFGLKRADLSTVDYISLEDATVNDVTLTRDGDTVKVGYAGVKGCVYLLGVYNGGKLVRVEKIWNGTSKTANEALNWSGSVASGQTVKLFLLDGTTFAPMKAALSPSAS